MFPSINELTNQKGSLKHGQFATLDNKIKWTFDRMGTTKVYVHLIRRKKIHNKKHGYWIFIGTVIMDSEATQYAT